MRVPRMTCRCWMVAVAAAGVTVWGAIASEKWQRCEAAAEDHEMWSRIELENSHALLIDLVCPNGRQTMTAEERSELDASRSRREAEYRAACLRRAAFHERARRIFELAKWRLWDALPDVPDDPPES